MAIQQMLFAKSAAVGDKVVATGGTIYTNGNYKVHVFTASGTFSISEINDANATLDVFLVGGGSNGSAGDSSLYDFDGRNGGYGGSGGNYRTYSSLAFGTYFNAANYSVSVGGVGSSSSANNKTASAFVSSGASSGGAGGAQGSGASYDGFTQTCYAYGDDGGLGGAGVSNNWTGTTYVYAGGGGGGGGGAANSAACYAGFGGIRGNTSAGNGGDGGAYHSAGSAGFNASTTGLRRGGGGGGGGGAGSNDEDGTYIPGGAGGVGSAGIVIIRYQFQ